MKSWGDEKKDITFKYWCRGTCCWHSISPWHSRSTFQVLRGAKHESCRYFWLKSTSELWGCWCSLFATQSRKKICPSQHSAYPERLVKETCFIDHSYSKWLSILPCIKWREMSSLCSPAEIVSFKYLLNKEMSNAVRGYIIPFKYSTAFENQEPDLKNGFNTIAYNCLPRTHSCTKICLP